MKKSLLSTFISLVFLLTACGETNTPVPTVEPVLASRPVVVAEGTLLPDPSIELAFAQPGILAEVLVWQLQIGNHYWRNRTFLVGEFPLFEVLDVRRNPFAIAGTSFFKRRDFIIDFARERLLVRTR